MSDTTEDQVELTGWQAVLGKAATLFDRSSAGRKRASELLWKGAVEGINSWDQSIDSGAENLYNEVLAALGKARKGDASKIKTVALAVKHHGLEVAVYPNLSKAYAEATRLSKTIANEATEDEAADKAIAALGPIGDTANTPEDAAKIVLAKGVDEAARLLLDALGATNEAAHRALLRALSAEIAGRVKPVTKTVVSGPKAGAVQAGKAKAGPKAKAQPASAKAKPVKPVAQAAVAEKAAAAVGVKARPVARPIARPVRKQG